MLRLLLSGDIAVANADGNISESEKAVFEKFFGDGSFKDDLNIALITSELENRIRQAVEKTSVPHRMQVLRDLCLVARSEDEIGNPERQELKRIARQLDIRGRFVDQCLEGALDPD